MIDINKFGISYSYDAMMISFTSSIDRFCITNGKQISHSIISYTLDLDREPSSLQNEIEMKNFQYFNLWLNYFIKSYSKYHKCFRVWLPIAYTSNNTQCTVSLVTMMHFQTYNIKYEYAWNEISV